MNKKWLGVALSALLLVTAGCGQSDDTKKADVSKETITVSAAASMQAAMNELKDDYVKAHHLDPRSQLITAVPVRCGSKLSRGHLRPFLFLLTKVI